MDARRLARYEPLPRWTGSKVTRFLPHGRLVAWTLYLPSGHGGYRVTACTN